MKKICKKCKRNRRIGKFGRDKNTSDGKRIYCRECVSKFNRKYKNTTTHKKTVEKWKSENKDKIKEYNKNYYIQYKERIIRNKKIRDERKKILFFENIGKTEKIKINKSSEKYMIEINPKRRKND